MGTTSALDFGTDTNSVDEYDDTAEHQQIPHKSSQITHTAGGSG